MRSIKDIEAIFQLMQDYQINTFKDGDMEVTKLRHLDKAPELRLKELQNKYLSGIVEK